MTKPPERIDTVRNPVLDALRRGDLATVLSIRLVRTPEIALIARAAGFDGIFVDLEHSAMSDETVSQVNVTALAAGVAPLVHVPSARSERIGVSLDAGALGIIVPHVETADDARAAASATRYAPRGARGISSALPQFDYRTVPSDSATSAIDAATVVIAMVESQAAADHADEIAAVDGVDVLMIGANDLTADLGAPGAYDSKPARAAYRQVIRAAEAHGKYAGVGGIPLDGGTLPGLIQAGMRFVSAGPEVRHLLRAVTAWNDEIRSGL